MDVVARIVLDMGLVVAFALNAFWLGTGERGWLVYVGLICCGFASLILCVEANNNDHHNLHRPDAARRWYGRRGVLGAMGERMTREEEIKARHKNGYLTVQRTFSVPDGFDGGICRVIDKDQKDKDFEYLLARNEELQQRAIRLESGILHALDYWNRCEELGAMSDALHEIENRLNDALDAKEQDDD